MFWGNVSRGKAGSGKGGQGKEEEGDGCADGGKWSNSMLDACDGFLLILAFLRNPAFGEVCERSTKLIRAETNGRRNARGGEMGGGREGCGRENIQVETARALRALYALIACT